ncbi:MAG TPA: endonuclease III domain-containing protein [Candidatus Hydrogenedentes bacterium]|nr:endonuclease III domain-containing protein [Candidatus Hydrogenedentota bacterium]
MSRLSALGRSALYRFYRLMSRHYGPTGWWPGDTPFEIAVGAILTQNTAWRNVERAIANLKQLDALEPQALVALTDAELEEALRPSGYFRQKAERVRRFTRWLLERHGGRLESLAELPLSRAREELLALNGIGPETADDILLYACGFPVFVIDAYTRRILARHGMPEALSMPYEQLRHYIESRLDRDIPLFREYHGLIVWTGKDFCRRRARCEGCPLAELPKDPTIGT